VSQNRYPATKVRQRTQEWRPQSSTLEKKREAVQLREMLERQGFSGDSMVELPNRFEPNRLAHRISGDRLWISSGMYHTVVPPIHADSFAQAARLAEDHHIRMPANHYSGLIFLPVILGRIATKCGGRAILAQSP